MAHEVARRWFEHSEKVISQYQMLMEEIPRLREEGESIKAIAEKLGVREATVRNLLSAAAKTRE